MAKCSDGNLNRKHILLVTVRHNLPDLLGVLFYSGVADFTKQISLSWVNLFAMPFINAFKESINFKGIFLFWVTLFGMPFINAVKESIKF